MTQDLDLADIQGNILQDFVSGYPVARFVLLHVAEPEKGRSFVLEYRKKVTTALRWAASGAYAQKIQTTKPDVAINIGFTFPGLLALGLPTRMLARLPPEFIDGMKMRAAILGDDEGPTAGVDPMLKWDPVWAERAHILVGLNGMIDDQGHAQPGLQRETDHLLALCRTYNLTVLRGHVGADDRWQDAHARLAKNKATYRPVPMEHFGFIDGISNPVFEGQFGDPHADAAMAIGNGKVLEKAPEGGDGSRWAPLATGEFLLGHPDEAQETEDTAPPPALMRNGTFLVYRKLHENVGRFNAYFAESAKVYAKANNVPVADAGMILKAKMAGRWEDGVPVAVAPTIADWNAFNARFAGKDLDRPYVDFTYGDDPDGARCPVASHMRRTNTRDSLTGKSSALNNRRRILRRGIPYGETSEDDGQEHGIVFLAMCASIARQFEFVQQQWINYGLDANAGNDTCPIAGNRKGDAKFIIPVYPKSGDTPFICDGIPQFVEMRGGDYFFLPGMTALRMIGMGTVDPT